MLRFRARRFPLFLGLVLLSVSFARSPAACPMDRITDHRVQLAPRFAEGATLRYRIETRTSSAEHTTTPVANTDGGAQIKQTTSFVVRLDVLGVHSVAPDATSVRLRATFEKANADSATDVVTPEQNALDDSINRFEGHSFEFTIGPADEPTDVKGIDQLTTNPAAADRALSWISVLSSAGSFPKNGVEIGQKWNSDRDLTGLPLTGLVWRMESSYLRNEQCAVAQTQEDCAIILTHFEISRRGSPHSDATPEDYRRNGLRTSGKWTGSGESLNSVSLVNGFLVSSTQTATQDMDYEIVSASSGSRIHHVGHTATQTEINLVVGAAAPAS